MKSKQPIRMATLLGLVSSPLTAEALLLLSNLPLLFAMALLWLLGPQLATAFAQTTILSEDFEGAFPGAWSVGDGNGAGTPAYWKDVNAAFGGEGAHSGAWKGYCAGTGYGGTADNPAYQNDMSAYMSRTIDLSGYVGATLTFWYKIPSIESCCDRARVLLSGIDPIQLWTMAAPVAEWTPVTIDLSPYVGSVRTLTFQFESDYSVTAEGWYLDDILVSGVTVPANDDWCAPLALAEGVPHTQDTTGATSDSVAPLCQANFGKGVWFTYTAPADGQVEVSTCGSSFDTVLQVYTGPLCRLLTPLSGGCNDDNGPACAGVQASLRFDCSAGTTYHIQAGGYGSAGGNLRIVARYLDTIPPQIGCPADLILSADPDLCSRANVTFTATATDNVAVTSLACGPPSGSTFPVGVTTVICTATDAAGNTDTCEFAVTVRGPPVVVAQPQNQTNDVDTPATFHVAACGSPPLAYQWLFNGQVLPDATNFSHTIASVQPSHAGEYQVLVSNPFGSATSAVARLTLHLTNKVDRWASEAIQTALDTAVYAELRAALAAHHYQVQPWLAQVQWGFDYRSKDPRPVCQTVTIPCYSLTGSDRTAILCVLLGIGSSEDGQLLGPHPPWGGVVLIADVRGEQRSVWRILCDWEGVSRPLEELDEACLAEWFHPATVPPETPTYTAMIADLVLSWLDCAAVGGPGGETGVRVCRRAARAMGLFTFCVLGICLPPDFQEALGALPGLRPSAGNAFSGTGRVAGAGPLIDGTQTCCGWDPGETGLIGGIVGAASGGFDLGGGLVGAILGGLPALFEVNDDEAEWCVARAEQYAVLEGTVGAMSGRVWQGTAGSLPTHFSSEDNPFTHDSLDWIIDVAPFSSNEAWAGSPDYTWLASQFNKSDGGQRMIECEWESKFVPDFIRTWPGDRVWMRGQLIFDCGHPAGIGGAWGYRSEIHPPHALVTMRLEGAVLGANTVALPARVARVYITPWAGEANHPDNINTDGRVWSSGAAGWPRFDAAHTPYQFKVPLPPTPRNCELTRGTAPAVLVKIEPAAALSAPTSSRVDGPGLRVTRQDASHSYLQKVLTDVVVSLWPDTAHPDCLLVKVPLTEGPIPDLGGGISPIQFKVAVGWNDAPLALQVSATMPVLDEEGVFEVPADESPVIISPAHPLAKGRGWVPPDRRTLLRVTGPDCAWEVTPVRVEFTEIQVHDDHDLHSAGDFHVHVGANGEWRFLPGLDDNGASGGSQYSLGVSVPIGVWDRNDPRLDIVAVGFEADQMDWGIDQDDDLGRIFMRTEAPAFVQPLKTVLSSAGDYGLSYQVVSTETVCASDTLDPANNQPAGATSITAPGSRSFSNLRVGPSDPADWFALDTDDYMTLTATLSDQTALAADRCRTYSLQVIADRAVIPPDQFDDGLVSSTPCPNAQTLKIQEVAGRNDDWASSPILRLCSSPIRLSDFDCEVHPLFNDLNPDGLALENLNFHLPYPGVSSTPDRDFYQIEIPQGLDEQCFVPCPKILQGKLHPAGLFILIEADRDRPLLVTVTNFVTGFALDNDPATPTPDTWSTTDGHMKISRKGTTTRIDLECLRGSGLFPDGRVGLALADPEGKRNFYDLFASYNRQAWCDVSRPLESPGLMELILGKLWGNRDPVPVRFLPVIGYSDPVNPAVTRAKSLPFVDLPPDGGTVPVEDRWLVLLPRGNATLDITVEPPVGALSFDVEIELRNLADQPLARAQETGGVAAGAAAPTGAMAQISPASQHAMPRRYHLEASQLDGCFYFLTVNRPLAGGTFKVDFTFSRTPQLAVTPSALLFGNRCTNWPGPFKWITVSNTGKATLTVSNVGLVGPDASDFSLGGLPGLPADLSPGASVSFGVRFHPTRLAPSLADVRIESNDPNQPVFWLALSGSGQAGDIDPPVLICPTNLTVWTCAGAAQVQYVVAATDDCDTNFAVQCSPPPGSWFPVGTNWVQCVVTDSAGRSNQCAFAVYVWPDTEPPQTHCPTNRVANCMGTNGTPVFFLAEAQDNSGSPVAVTCTPPSGSWFPSGLTTVTCEAVDTCGNRGQSSFPVIVQEQGPLLSIVRDGSRAVIAWPAACATYSVQTTTHLAPPTWLPLPAVPMITPDGYSVTVEITNTTRFYRLIRQP